MKSHQHSHSFSSCRHVLVKIVFLSSLGKFLERFSRFVYPCLLLSELQSFIIHYQLRFAINSVIFFFPYIFEAFFFRNVLDSIFHKDCLHCRRNRRYSIYLHDLLISLSGAALNFYLFFLVAISKRASTSDRVYKVSSAISFHFLFFLAYQIAISVFSVHGFTSCALIATMNYVSILSNNKCNIKLFFFIGSHLSRGHVHYNRCWLS